MSIMSQCASLSAALALLAFRRVPTLRSMERPKPPPARHRGRTFDEFLDGERIVSAARTLTEADVVAFAGLSGDFTPLHVDAEYASSTPFRGRIAHGLLVQSIASGLAAQTGAFEGTVVAFREMRIEFQAPVVPGDTIRLELELVERDARPKPRRGWLRFASRVFNQRDDLVIDGHWTLILARGRDST